MNQVVLIGRLTKDVGVRYSPGGTPIATFTLAVDRELSKEKRVEAEAKGSPTADFVRVIVWGKSGENCSRFLSKGSQCAVHGRITTGSYNASDGSRRYTTDVTAQRVEFLGRAAHASGDEAVEEVQEEEMALTMDDFPF